MQFIEAEIRGDISPLISDRGNDRKNVGKKYFFNENLPQNWTETRYYLYNNKMLCKSIFGMLYSIL